MPGEVFFPQVLWQTCELHTESLETIFKSLSLDLWCRCANHLATVMSNAAHAYQTRGMCREFHDYQAKLIDNAFENRLIFWRDLSSSNCSTTSNLTVSTQFLSLVSSSMMRNGFGLFFPHDKTFANIGFYRGGKNVFADFLKPERDSSSIFCLCIFCTTNFGGGELSD